MVDPALGIPAAPVLHLSCPDPGQVDAIDGVHVTTGEDDRRLRVGAEISPEVQAPALQVGVPCRVVDEREGGSRLADAGLPLGPAGDVVDPGPQLVRITRREVSHEVQTGTLRRIVVQRLAAEGDGLLILLCRVDVVVVEPREVAARQLDPELVVVGLPGEAALELPGDLVGASLRERRGSERPCRGQDVCALAE